MDRGQNRTAAQKSALAETLGPDGGPQTPKSAPGAAGGASGKETSTQHLFPPKMLKTGGKAGADAGGARAQGATIGKKGGEHSNRHREPRQGRRRANISGKNENTIQIKFIKEKIMWQREHAPYITAREPMAHNRPPS